MQSIPNELLGAREAAIRRLPDEHRPVSILRDVDGLTRREVEKLLDLSVRAVKSRLHRSRLMVRRRFQKIFPEPQRRQPEQAIPPHQDEACELGVVNSSGRGEAAGELGGLTRRGHRAGRVCPSSISSIQTTHHCRGCQDELGISRRNCPYRVLL